MPPAHLLKCGGDGSAQVEPPSEDTAVARPRAPPLDQRSCWKTAMRCDGLAGSTATAGSTSAFTLLVPGGDPGSRPPVQPANGLGPDASDNGPTLDGAAAAWTGSASANAAPTAAKEKRSEVRIGPPRVEGAGQPVALEPAPCAPQPKQPAPT